MPKRFNNIILPLYSGADEAFSRNSNTNFHSTTPDTTDTANTTSLTFMGFAIFPIFLIRQHADTIQEHHATVL